MLICLKMMVEITYPIAATMDSLDVDTIVDVKQPEKMEEYPIIGVLDTGIADISYLKPWKEATEHENYPPEYQDNSHGTFVAGIIEYGDELNNKKVSALDGVKLFNAVVHPGNAMTIYLEELIDNVREAFELALENKDALAWKFAGILGLEQLEVAFLSLLPVIGVTALSIIMIKIKGYWLEKNEIVEPEK